MLDGITVLDLASVGPAARARRAGWPTTAPPWSRSARSRPAPGCRSRRRSTPTAPTAVSKRVLVDLKAPAGREAFLRLVDGADVVIESFRPGVIDRLGIGYADARRAQPGRRAVLDVGVRPGRARTRRGPATTSTTWGCRASSPAPRPEPTAGPPIPGATVADSAGGGMHAVVAILAALVRRAAPRRGRPPRRVGRRRHAVADGAGGRRVPRHRRRRRARAQGLLTGRYACYGVYGTADGRWLTVAAIEPRFWANLCQALGLERWIDHQTDDAVQDQVRADIEAVLRTRPRDEWVAALAPGRHLRRAGARRSTRSSTTPSTPPGGRSSRPSTRRTAPSARWGRCGPAPIRSPTTARPRRVGDRHRRPAGRRRPVHRRRSPTLRECGGVVA